MKTRTQLTTASALTLAASLWISTSNIQAQNPPDPAQMRQMMLERMREHYDVKNDAEWKVISERIEKVIEARSAVGGGAGGLGGFGGRGPGGPGGGGGRGPGGPGGFNGQPDPEAEALLSAIQSNASADDLKAKLAKLREARKQKTAKLEKAQSDLREVLSARQEAVAVMAGLLK
jgi:hypothetical protein